jgi:hypothetical protein
MLAPWWCADHVATVLTLGGTMTAKKAIVAALLVSLLTGGGITWHAAREHPTPGRALPPKTHGDVSVSQAAAEGDTQETATRQGVSFAAGTVMDETMAPLSGVSIVFRCMEESGDREQPEWLVPADLAKRAVCVTGPDGRFAVAEPVPDMHALAFFRDGYAGRQLRVSLDDRARNQNLRVVLTRGRSFEGTVHDTAARPIRLAQIAVFASDLEVEVGQYAYTDSDGRFALGMLGQPYSMVVVGAPGYEYRVLQGADLGPHADLVLRRNSIVIDVTDELDGRPIVHPHATLLRDRSTYVQVATTPRLPFALVVGRITLQFAGLGREDLPVGDLHVFADGYRTRAVPVRLLRGEEPPHLHVGLVRGEEPPTVAGRVECNIAAVLELRAGAPEGHGLTPDEQLPLLFRLDDVMGRFLFPAVPPGRYRLVAKAPGRSLLGIDVAPPQTDLVVRLEEGATLEILTRDARGAPLSGHPVHVECDGAPTQCWNAVSGDDGVARLDGLPAGRARASPVHAEYAPLPWEHVPHVSAQLTAGGRTRAELTVPVRRSFMILVREDTGAACAGITLAISAGRGYAVQAKEYDRLYGLGLQTDASGRAQAELFPGEYKVSYRIGPTGSERYFEVPDREGATYEIAVLTRGAGISGRVVERGSAGAVAKRPIYVGFADSARARGWLGTCVTDEAGRYEITGLPEGELRVMVAGHSSAEGWHDSTSPYPRAAKTIVLARGEQRVVDFKLPRVRGDGAEQPSVPFVALVRDAGTGAPIADAHAFTEGWIEDAWVDAGQAATDGTGRAEGKVLDAQRYRVWVHGPAMRYDPTEAEGLLADGVLTVEVALKLRGR